MKKLILVSLTYRGVRRFGFFWVDGYNTAVDVDEVTVKLFGSTLPRGVTITIG